MRLEASDDKNPEEVHAASVAEVKYNSLLIHYDGWPSSHDFWCDLNSVSLHPVGWCDEHDCELEKPQGKLAQPLSPFKIIIIIL